MLRNCLNENIGTNKLKKTGNDKSEIFELKIIESGELLVMTMVAGV